MKVEFDVSACAGPTVFPQFFFPGWAAETDTGGKLAVIPDPNSGLVLVAVPAATGQITLHRTWLTIEHLGLYVSVISLGLWLCLFYASSRSQRRYQAGA